MLPIAFIGNQELIVIGVVVLVLLFGVKRLPELGRSLAEGISEFKKASKKAREEEQDNSQPAGESSQKET